jgi:hypothetical protein
MVEEQATQETSAKKGEKQSQAQLSSYFLLGLFFDPYVGDDLLLRNVGTARRYIITTGVRTSNATQTSRELFQL